MNEEMASFMHTNYTNLCTYKIGYLVKLKIQVCKLSNKAVTYNNYSDCSVREYLFIIDNDQFSGKCFKCHHRLYSKCWATLNL